MFELYLQTQSPNVLCLMYDINIIVAITIYYFKLCAIIFILFPLLLLYIFYFYLYKEESFIKVSNINVNLFPKSLVLKSLGI